MWSAASLAHHNPPSDFLWKDQHKWGTGPECTTILCKQNGQVGVLNMSGHIVRVKNEYIVWIFTSIVYDVMPEEKVYDVMPEEKV